MHMNVPPRSLLSSVTDLAEGKSFATWNVRGAVNLENTFLPVPRAQITTVTRMFLTTLKTWIAGFRRGQTFASYPQRPMIQFVGNIVAVIGPCRVLARRAVERAGTADRKRSRETGPLAMFWKSFGKHWQLGRAVS